ncbi:MAG: IPT/TIG domain-containing protein [Deltaproteobacteria bacterium]|nr:IPT/TIG domain-containing protein [Deltaproteobacteria bacterium]
MKRPNLIHAAILGAALALAAGCDDDTGAGGADTSTATDTSVTPDTSTPDSTTSTSTSDPDTSVAPDVDEEEELVLGAVIPGRGLTIGLEQVELTGTGFFQGNQVFFGESLAQDIFVLNSRRMVVLTPPRGAGLVDVRVVDPDPQNPRVSVLEAGFLYYNPVSITSIEPAFGHVLGGEAVTLRGQGFRPESVVLFGRRAALQIQVLDDTTITCVTPYGGTVGAVDVHVSNQLGVGTLENGYSYIDVPVITAVVPPVGPTAGGNAIEIRGEGFHEPLTVLVGGKALDGLVRVSDTKIRGFVPQHAAGAVDVVVATPYGTRVRERGYTFVDDITPGATLELLAISPGSGSAAGGEQVVVVAKGLGTTADTELFIGSSRAIVRAVDANQLTLIADTPAGAPGAVDVRLVRGAQSSTLEDAFLYRPFSRVTSVTPDRGPVAGGTPITVKGQGFSPGMQLRVGALPAGQLVVEDAQTAKAVTPPGAPGAAPIVVVQSGQVATLPDAFTYEAPYALFLVDPSQGSQAGGTLISLIGSGFPTDAKVKVGGRNATHVKVWSSTLITAKTPPGDLGTVDVTLTSPTLGDIVMPEAFTYYDPTSLSGGTWGNQVDGDVNVTVLDGSSGAGMPDAFVMLWTDPETPYQGFTNQDGQITFSGPDLAGEQMVSASKTGFASQSVVEYNATNITLFLTPTTPPSPGTPPAVEPPFLTGVVKNLGKSVPIPFGKCTSKPNAPGNLCNACVTDTDCGAGYQCTELPEQYGAEPGRFCTQSCTAPSQCPSDFTCLPIDGPDMQCVPKSGDLTAFCDVTNASIFSQDYIPDPGVEVDSNGEFSFTPPFGEFAVYCYAGVVDSTTFVFTPLALGVERHVFANPGDQIHVEIEMDHPLNFRFQFDLDNVPIGSEGPHEQFLFPYIDLASDGVIAWPLLFAPIGQPFVIDRFLGSFTGDLYDASFTFYGGAYSYTATSLPQTLTLHQNIKRLEDDTMFYLDEGAWEARRTGVVENVNGLWWTGDDIVGVGTDGLVVRSIADSWARQEGGTDSDLRAVHGDGAGLMVAVGDDGAVTHWDGFQWVEEPSPTTSDLRGVWLGSGEAAGEGWAVGFYTVLRRQAGGAWTLATAPSRNLYGVYGFAKDDVWAVGASGTILRFDGVAWNVVPSGTSIGLRAVWGAAPDDVWMVGEGGLVLHWDGSVITRTMLDTTRTLTAIWGSGPDDVVVVGSRGTGFGWDGEAWERIDFGPAARDVDFIAIGGPPEAPVATGENELVLGPILACPEKIVPTDGGIMGAEYRISWKNVTGPDPHFSYVEVSVPTLFGPMPEWTVINDFDVQSVLLPDFPSIEGTPGIAPGQKILTIMRVYKEGFDIDHYSYSDMSAWGWRSWSIHEIGFAKL